MSRLKSRTMIVLILGLNIVLLITAISVAIYRSSQNAQLEVLITPTAGKVIIDGKEYQNGTYNLFPGEYVAKIEAENFESKEKTIKLESGQTTRLYEFLNEEGGGFEHYKKNADDMVVLQQIGKDDKNLEEFLTKYKKTVSIREILPYNYDAYSNNYREYTNFSIRESHRQDCPKTICLEIIDRTENSKQAAMSVLEKYDIDNYEIVYKIEDENGMTKEVDL